MESKCSRSDVPWSGGSGAKCLGNYLDHLMLLRVALAAGEPACAVEQSVRKSSLAAPGQCALWRPQVQQQQQQQQQQQPVPPQSVTPEQPPQWWRSQPLGDRSPPPHRRTRRRGSAEEQRPPVPKECSTAPRSPSAPEASSGGGAAAAEENIYFELEPTAAAAGQAEQAPANVARLALDRLSALAERGLLDVATASAASSPCERDGDARRPATVPRAARPHATPERRGAGFRRVSSVADALALAGDCERAAAAGCEQLLLDLCSGDSGEHRWQHRRQSLQPTSLRHELDASPAAAADHRAELTLLADAEPVYETIPCDDAADDDAEFDTVQHSSCSRRRVAAPRPPPRQSSASFEQPPQLPPPRQPQASTTQPRSRLASAGESETDSCFDGDVTSLSSTSDDMRVQRAAAAAASAEKGPSCSSSELQMCRIKMGVAAKKAWDERCVRRPSQTLAVAAAAAAHPSAEGAALAAKCRRNSAAACSATAPSRPAVGLAAPYKALPAVRC